MMPELTDEMRQALADHPGQPVRVVDTAMHRTYVLVPADTYQKIHALLFDGSEEANVDEFMPLAHEAFAEDWNAPGMEAYDDYDQHRQAS